MSLGSATAAEAAKRLTVTMFVVIIVCMIVAKGCDVIIDANRFRTHEGKIYVKYKGTYHKLSTNTYRFQREIKLSGATTVDKE